MLPECQGIVYQRTASQFDGMARPQSKVLKDALAAYGPKLKILLEQQDLSQPDLERAMKRKGQKVATKTVNNIVNARHSTELGNLAAIADHFQIPLWVMFIPDLPPEMLDKDKLARLVKLVTEYCQCDDTDRKHVENMAAAHCSANNRQK